MMRHFRRLLSGDMAYRTPPMPVRGYDSVFRGALSIIRWKSDEVDGPGAAAGNYARSAPFIFHGVHQAVIADAQGRGTPNNNPASAGMLIDPAYLLSPLIKGQ